MTEVNRVYALLNTACCHWFITSYVFPFQLLRSRPHSAQAYAMMTVGCLSVCLSVCPSVCLSVPCLTLSRERNGVGSWNVGEGKPMKRVTRDPIQRPEGQRSRSLNRPVRNFGTDSCHLVNCDCRPTREVHSKACSRNKRTHPTAEIDDCKDSSSEQQPATAQCQQLITHWKPLLQL